VDLAAEIRKRLRERLGALANGNSGMEQPRESSRRETVSAVAPNVMRPVAPQRPGRLLLPSARIDLDGRLFSRSNSARLAVTPDDVIEIAVAVLAVLISPGASIEVQSRSLARPSTLTARQQAVSRLVAEGLSNKQIALSLNLSVPTVKTHFFWAMEKLGTENRTRAAVLASQRGLL
jgi:DNA-binding CsgD family transcriptional regulator